MNKDGMKHWQRATRQWQHFDGFKLVFFLKKKIILFSSFSS